MGSIYEDLLVAAKATIVALALPGVLANVQIMKLPAVEEEIDTLPLIAVVPADVAEDVRHASFEDQLDVVYSVELVIISRGKRLLGPEGNPSANEDLYRELDWRQRARRAFHDPRSLGVTGLWKADVRPGKPIDRARVNQLYDYLPVTIRFNVLEPDHN